MLHDPDLAEAILDRVLERSRILPYNGPSYSTRNLHSQGGSIVSGIVGLEFQERTPLEASGCAKSS